MRSCKDLYDTEIFWKILKDQESINGVKVKKQVSFFLENKKSFNLLANQSQLQYDLLLKCNLIKIYGKTYEKVKKNSKSRECLHK